MSSADDLRLWLMSFPPHPVMAPYPVDETVLTWSLMYYNYVLTSTAHVIRYGHQVNQSCYGEFLLIMN